MGVGDMNDYRGHGLAKKKVKLAGLTTRLSDKIQRTCTEPSHFKGVGDMIFDSADGTTKKHGVPKLPHGWGPYTQLMSDHLPVYAVKEFHSAGPHAAEKKRKLDAEVAQVEKKRKLDAEVAAEKKRKLDAEDSRETKLRSRSPSLTPEEVARWDDVDLPWLHKLHTDIWQRKRNDKLRKKADKKKQHRNKPRTRR